MNTVKSNAAGNANASTDVSVLAAQQKYLSNEQNIKDYSAQLAALQSDYGSVRAVWQKLSGATGVIEAIFLGRFGNIKNAQEAKNKMHDLEIQIAAKVDQINTAVAQRKTLQDAITTAQVNSDKSRASAAQLALTEAQSEALTNPEIVKAKAALSAALSSATTKKVIVISIIVLIVAAAGLFAWLKYKNKI